MRGSSVSKVFSKVQSNHTLARAAQTGSPLLRSCGRVPYHTFAAPRRNSTGSFHTSLLNFSNNANTIALQPIAESMATFKLPRKIVWLLGAPGAGKGTNSSHVAQQCGIRSNTIVMSSLLESPACQRIKDAGGMVDDDTVCKVLMEELSKPQYRDGAVVDGFPRTQQQAAWLSRMHGSISETGGTPPKMTFVMLSLNEESSIARQLSRGTTIREINRIRMMSGMDALEVRATDVCEDAARTRFRVFAEQVDAVTQHCSSFNLAVVDADASIDAVRLRLTSALTPASPSRSPSVSTRARRMSLGLTSALTSTPASPSRSPSVPTRARRMSLSSATTSLFSSTGGLAFA